MSLTRVTNLTTSSLPVISNTTDESMSVGDSSSKRELQAGRDQSVAEFLELDLPHTPLEIDKTNKAVASPVEKELQEFASNYRAGCAAGVALALACIPGSQKAATDHVRWPKDVGPFASRDDAYQQGLAAGAQAVLKVSTKRSDQALEQADSLIGKIHEAENKLRLGLRALNVTGLESTTTDAGYVTSTTLSNRDRLDLAKHWAKGAFAATVSSVGAGTVALALPAVTGGSAFATGAAAYVIGRVVGQLPELLKNNAAMSLIKSAQENLVPLLDDLRHLVTQEKLRQTMVERICLISFEREAAVNAIQLELSQVSKAIESLPRTLESNEDGGSSLMPSMPVDRPAHPPSPAKLESVRVTLRAFLNSISESFSQFFRFLSDLPLYFVPADAPQDETAFLEDNKAPLKVLSTPSRSSLYSSDDHVRMMRREGIKKENMGQASEEPRRLFHIGENLVRIIKDANTPTVGAVLVADSQSSGSWVVPAHLSLAHAMGTYFSMVASEAGDVPARGGVTRNQDGSLSVDDPRGELYGFLMSMPSAYTGSMVGLPHGQATCRLTLDDPGKKFPGGARSMQFEQSLKLDADGEPVVDVNGNVVTELQIRFTSNQPNPVYAPLANESRLLRDLQMISIATEQEAAESVQTNAAPYAGSAQSLDRLLQRQEELTERLKRETALLEAGTLQVGALQYHWDLPKPDVSPPAPSRA